MIGDAARSEDRGRGDVRVDHDVDGRAVEGGGRYVAGGLREDRVERRDAAVALADGGVVREAARRRGAVGVGLGDDARALGHGPAGGLAVGVVDDRGEVDRLGDDRVAFVVLDGAVRAARAGGGRRGEHVGAGEHLRAALERGLVEAERLA